MRKGISWPDFLVALYGVTAVFAIFIGIVFGVIDARWKLLVAGALASAPLLIYGYARGNIKEIIKAWKNRSADKSQSAPPDMAKRETTAPKPTRGSGNPANLLLWMLDKEIYSDNPKKARDMAGKRKGEANSLRNIQREVRVLRDVNLLEGKPKDGYYLPEWLKKVNIKHFLGADEGLKLLIKPTLSDEEIEKIKARVKALKAENRSAPIPLINGLQEDIGEGDFSTDLTFKLTSLSKRRIKAKILARKEGIVCGLDVARDMFKTLDKEISFQAQVKDGQKVKKGKVLAYIEGNGASILKAERVALNFLIHLSGVATLTKKYVRKVKAYPNVKVMEDSRRTTPTFRELERYAVRCGGGVNQAENQKLIDLAVISAHPEAFKDHTAIATLIKQKRQEGGEIKVRVTNLEQFQHALKLVPDIITLDSMSIEDVKQAVEERNKSQVTSRKSPELEVSGNINLKNVHEFAACGVERITPDTLTNSAGILDIGLDIHEPDSVFGSKRKSRKHSSRFKRSFGNIILVGITTIPAILGIAYHYRTAISGIGAKLLQWFVSIGAIRGLPWKFSAFSLLSPINILSKILPNSFNLVDIVPSTWSLESDALLWLIGIVLGLFISLPIVVVGLTVWFKKSKAPSSIADDRGMYLFKMPENSKFRPGEQILFAGCDTYVDTLKEDEIDTLAEKIAGVIEKAAKVYEKRTGKKAVVAALSYATTKKGAKLSRDPYVLYMEKAVEIVKERCPDINILGVTQFDAAIRKKVFLDKTKLNSVPEGFPANVFVFPNLQSFETAKDMMDFFKSRPAIGKKSKLSSRYLEEFERIAKSKQTRIVIPESTNPRVLAAVE
ncbi:carboxylating nicotinate-nucleotide diphosphorylase, partial [bacterium]|nr:carboxylating nicotinate-nucleotide diphosphorylase [bacterium]